MFNKQRKRLLWQIPFLAALIVGTILIIRQQRSMPYQHDTGFIFGTIYNITYQNDKDLNAEIVAELNRVDASMSMFNKQSTISRINRNEAITSSNLFLVSPTSENIEWSWRESNPRPNRETIRFLHAYSGLQFSC